MTYNKEVFLMVVRVDKKDLIIDGAVAIFAENGFYKATTAQVAKAAGVTQPYVFHFFKSKEDLYLAVIDRAFSRIYEVFVGIEAPTEQLYGAMSMAFIDVMKSHRDEILLLMQSHTIAEPIIREHVGGKYNLVYEAVLNKFQQAGLMDPDRLASQFIGDGMMLTLAEILNLPKLCQYNNA
jgi:AcrR family transcriptional regulator